MQDFKKLSIYNKSVSFCSEVYEFSACLPHDEKYGLISQIKRAAVSIPLNISEGAGASTKSEFCLFLSYAYRSVNEVLACLELIDKLKLIDDANNIINLECDAIELCKMIYSFMKKLKTED